MPQTPLDHMICFALYSAAQAMQQVYKPLLDPLGLTYPQYLTLVVLAADPDQTVGGLCAALGLETNTVTPMVKRLEAAGLVIRRRDRADERRIRLRLTDRGAALAKEQGRIGACIGQVVNLPAATIADFTTVLQDLGRQLRASRAIAQDPASASVGSGSAASAAAAGASVASPELPIA